MPACTAVDDVDSTQNSTEWTANSHASKRKSEKQLKNEDWATLCELRARTRDKEACEKNGLGSAAALHLCIVVEETGTARQRLHQKNTRLHLQGGIFASNLLR